MRGGSGESREDPLEISVDDVVVVEVLDARKDGSGQRPHQFTRS